MIVKSFFFLLLLVLTSCTTQNAGFAFFPVDEQTLSPLEKRLFMPTRFKKLTPPISFPAALSIYYIYTPRQAHYGEVYAISLSKFSLGWVEVDLYNKRLHKDIGLLWGKLVALEPGQYLMKVAYDNRVMDQIHFEIQEQQEKDEPDFDTEPLAQNSTEDDILLYSQ